jgi:hypothetical protein
LRHRSMSEASSTTRWLMASSFFASLDEFKGHLH